MSVDTPSCPRCPNEVICDLTTIVALPNYWGYKKHKGYIQMLRCPDQYCCERSGDCNSIDTCNTGRTGILCGRCTDELTESLFSANCFSMDKCYTLLFGLLYAGCVVIYSIFLGIFKDVKKKLVEIASKLLKFLQMKLKLNDKSKSMEGIQVSKESENIDQSIKSARKNSRLVDALLLDNCCNKPGKITTVGTILTGKEWKSQTITQKEDHELKVKIKKKNLPVEVKVARDKSDTDSGMKYVQIMLYYVQDATLFKIHLPNAKQQNENVLVKFLQFSPEILTLYYKVSDLCFTRNTTAVMKVFLSSMFGLCIILFLSLVYLILWIFSRYFGKVSSGWEILRSKLTQAFLLTILFSYQKIIIGAFSLIQCVDIDSNKVLYIQGDIQCYTWWQVAIEIYLYISVVPVFVTLAICPFLVKNKQMSVVMLIFACLLPVPVLLYQIILIILKAIRNSKRSKKSQNRSTDVILDYVRQIILHVPMHYGNRRNSSKKEASIDDSLSIDIQCAETSNLQKITHTCSHYTERIENLENTLRHRKNEDNIKVKTHSSDDRCEEKITKSASDQTTASEEVVFYILLKHYRPLRFLGISMTWLGLHKLYRMSLVACYTYIKEPLPRLSSMTILVMAMGLATMGIKPYRDDKANKTAIFSYIASILIAIINVSKASLITANYKTSSATVTTTLKYFDLCENILLTWLPVVAIVIWILHSIWQWFRVKAKKKKGK